MEYDNSGQVAFWRSNSDNERAPALRGSVIAHRDIKAGEELDIAVWKTDSDNERAPVLKGKISDKYVKDAAPAPSPTFDPNDIPF